jgi:hypothetical protein
LQSPRHYGRSTLRAASRHASRTCRSRSNKYGDYTVAGCRLSAAKHGARCAAHLRSLPKWCVHRNRGNCAQELHWPVRPRLWSRGIRRVRMLCSVACR